MPDTHVTALCAQGGPDPHLFSLDAHNNLYAIGLPGGVWVKSWPQQPPVPLTTLAVQDAPDPHLFGLDINNDLWAIGLPGGVWVKNWPQQPPVKLAHITAQSGNDPHLFGVDINGNPWAIGLPGGIWVENWPKPLPGPVLTLDQSQTSRNANGGGPDDWQSFTAGITGNMARLDVMVNSGLASGSQNGTIKIYAGEGTGGALLASQNFTFQSVYNTFQTCNFTTPFAVTAGQKYTYRLTIPTEPVGWIYTAPGSAYPNGRSNLPNTAMVFQTWVYPA